MTKVKVKLRSDGSYKEVPITSSDKPKLEDDMKKRWQNMANLIASFTNVRAGLIMEITQEAMQVFLMSENESNPYKVGGNDYLCHGLYCETVVGTDKELSIVDSRQLESWKDNPDVDIDMISYYGLPIKWPDGEFFGTICVLDDEPMDLTSDQKILLKEFKSSMEKDLKLLMT
ncbi:GAF domain-containing protein [Senegalia massiliensis]|uniref:GAF domain-containing protein n=1 Tax=Senegalia massiliensis TaxID=1720316 RepID=UPI001030BBEF|nr:GAF domain-containing protein [Senegalia massiliensis]